MTIHHFYISAWYFLWVYLLLCILAKLLSDHYGGSRRERQRQCIAEFFAAGHPERATDRAFRPVRRCVHDEKLFSWACSCYVRERGQYAPEEAEKLTVYMKALIHRRIDVVPADDALSRCLLIRSISQCQVRSRKISIFLERCAAGSPLEAYWSRTAIDEHKLLMAR